MQPRRLLIGTYGCGRRHQPARTGDPHESLPQPRVVGRVVRSGPHRLSHGCRARRRDRPPPCREATRRHRVRPPTVRAGADPGTIASAHAGSTSAHAGRVTGAHAITITSAHAGAVAHAGGLARSGTVTGTVGDARA
jgi:hypothetical protein